MIVGKCACQQEEERKGDVSIFAGVSGTVTCFRALQGHSGRNLIDSSSQDNVIIQIGFVQQIHHEGCAFNFLSSTMDRYLEVKSQAETDGILFAR